MGNLSSYYGVNRQNEVGNGRGHRDFSNGYAYGNTLSDNNGQSYGLEGGFGLRSGLLGNKDGWNAQSDLLSAYGFMGARSVQEADGSYSAWHGLGAKGTVAQIEGGYGTPGEGWYGRGSAEALTAEARSEFNPNQGYEFGLGADLVNGKISGGHLSKDSQHDVTGSLGVGFGIGGGFGGHWADEDGDGVREIGLHGSLAIGPGIAFDFRSETLGHAWNGAVDGYDWLSENGGAMWDSSTDWMGDAWDTSTDWAGDSWDSTTDAVSAGWNSTTDTIGSGLSTAGNWVSDTAGDVSAAVSSGWNSTTDTIGSGLSTAGNWASDTAGDVSSAVSSGWNSTTDTVGDFFSGW